MKSPHRITLSILASALLLPLFVAPVTSKVSAAGIKSASESTKYKVLWREEFNGKKREWPNEKYWTYDLGNNGGWGNNENEYYTMNNARTDCGAVKKIVGGKAKTVCTGNGSLVITANQIPQDSLEAASCASCLYFSSRLKTDGKLGFKYGRMEARIKMPKGLGTWPAFWMLGSDFASVSWPNCGEIDIVEVGTDEYTAHSTLHGPNNFGAGGITNGGTQLDAPLNTAYHTYRMDWFPTKIDFFIDRKLVYSISKNQVVREYNGKWVYNKEFFLIMNLAMGGNFVGGALDPRIKSTQMKIDYIRYFEIEQDGKKYGTLYKH